MDTDRAKGTNSGTKMIGKLELEKTGSIYPPEAMTSLYKE